VVDINRRHFSIASSVLVSSFVSGLHQPVHSQGRFEKAKVNLAVAGKTSFYYLPLVVAEQLGFFEAEGIALEIVDLPSPLRAQQALTSGGADVVCGAFEHLINMHSKQQLVQSFVSLGRAPQMAMGVCLKNMPNYKRMADLRGKKIGIAAPGTGTNMMVNLLLQRAGLPQSEVSYIGVGTTAGAISAVRSGQIDAICNLEPAMTQLELKGEIKIIADSRTLRGTQAIFGGDMPGACFYAMPEYILKNKQTIQALSNAIVRALKWLQTAGPRDLIRGLPDANLLGDRGLFLATYQNMRESISLDGVTGDEAARLSLKVMSSFDAVVNAERLDISKAYTNMFAKQSKSQFDA
jgi:NitT/TauT family transport system substrate-binding protein